MQRKAPPRGLLLTITMLLLPLPAHAQCTSSASSCLRCHEAQGARPVLAGPLQWHADHSFGDLCASCHGGAPAESDAALAHVGVRSPLAAPSASCAGCHASDFAERALRYRGPPSVTTPAQSPAAPRVDSAPTVSARRRTVRANRVLALAALLLGAALAALLRRRFGPTTAGSSLVASLRAARWNPYAAGALLGLVVAYSLVVQGRPVAASGAFDRLAAYAGRGLFPTSQYYRYVMAPAINWQVWTVVGIVLGAFASSRLSGTARLRWLPDEQWEARFGPRRSVRLLLVFVGAVLVQVGAGIAGGCTSGLAISGGAVLAPGAFLFMAGMFAGGMPAAWLWYRKGGAS